MLYLNSYCGFLMDFRILIGINRVGVEVRNDAFDFVYTTVYRSFLPLSFFNTIGR